MSLIVRSPFSGQPVKVRDQDVGRAVRDEEGRVFYVVPFADGNGFYASPTRNGGPKEEDRYRRMVEKDATLVEHRADTAPARPRAVHDATGRRKASPVRVVVFAVVAALLGGAGYAGWQWWTTGEVSLPGVQVVPQGASEGSEVGDQVPQKPALPSGEASPQSDASSAPLAVPGGDWDVNQFALPPRVAARFTPEPREREPFGRVDPLRSVLSEAGQGGVARSATVLPVGVEIGREFDPERYQAGAGAGVGVVSGVGVSGLRVREVSVGNGPMPNAGDYVLVSYRVKLVDGRVIDETPADEPFGFVLWSGQTFRGLEGGVAGMRAGGRRELLMPASWLAGSLRRLAGEMKLAHVEVELMAVLPGVRKVRLAPGAGRVAQPGDTVTVHWTLWAGERGEPFSDTRVVDQPFTLDLGAGDVVVGLELGITGMAEGEVVELSIPSYLAYGSAGAAGGLVPPHMGLRAQVELMRVGR